MNQLTSNQPSLHIVIAPDSFKGSLSAVQVADAVEKGLLRACPDASIRKVPIADGGEGTVEAMVTSTSGTIKRCHVHGPLGDIVESFWGILGDGQTAVIEMAAASGLTLVSHDQRNPKITSSYGTGELIIEALNYGCRKIIIGIGGSATNDGGSGMATALGARFLGEDGHEIEPGGAALAQLKHIDLSGMDLRIKELEILVACDVDNPLLGRNGASAIYGPQKGASPEDVAELDEALKNFSEVASRITGKDVCNRPGAGAAGGLGAGLIYFTNAELKSGIEIVIETTGMERLVASCDLVITGEGKTDFQTAMGKAPTGIGALARKYGKVAICLSGSLGEGADNLTNMGIQGLFSIAPGPISIDECMRNARPLLETAAYRLALLLKAGKNVWNPS